MAPKPVQFTIEKVTVWEDWHEECDACLRYAAALDIPHLPILEPHSGKCAIVCAGPSVKDYTKEIKAVQAGEFNIVVAVNAIHTWLIERGIIPNIQVLFEYDMSLLASLGGPPHKGVTYYTASFLKPKYFEALEGYNKVLWHAYIAPQGYIKMIDKYFPGEFMVCGGFTTFFRALAISMFLGYRDFELFGCDSSFEDSDHVEGYRLADVEEKLKIYGKHGSTGELKEFKTNGGLAHQAKDFLDFCAARHKEIKLKVHGNGLLHYLHESRYPDQYR